MIKAVAQKQIWHEHGYQNYLGAFAEHMHLQEVNVIPFTNQLQPEPDFVPDLVMGSTRFINIARERGWATFPSFDPVDFSLFPKDLWLNGDGWEGTVGQLYQEHNINQRVFIKPYTEKLFTAGVVDTGRYVSSQLQTTKTEEELYNERIWISRCREPVQEFRFFYVGGQLITGSLYKDKGIARYERIDSNSYFAQRVKGLTYPHINESFVGVVDMCTDPNGVLKLVELNNLNSSGVYATDYSALARALVAYLS